MGELLDLGLLWGFWTTIPIIIELNFDQIHWNRHIILLWHICLLKFQIFQSCRLWAGTEWSGLQVLYYTALPCILLHCSVVHCTSLHCKTLHCTPLHDTVLQFSAVHCASLQWSEFNCAVLNCTAMHFISISCITYYSPKALKPGTSGFKQFWGFICLSMLSTK